MDKKAMYQMGSRPMYAGQTNIVNPNDPNVPVEFQTGSYIEPQQLSQVPPNPDMVTGLEMQMPQPVPPQNQMGTAAVYKKSCKY